MTDLSPTGALILDANENGMVHGHPAALAKLEGDDLVIPYSDEGGTHWMTEAGWATPTASPTNQPTPIQQTARHQGGAAMTIPGYPKRAARCKHGDHTLRQDAPDTAWVDAFGGRECPDAPNPDDGPMPSHEPGSAILSPPVWPEAVVPRTDLEPPALPYMPG